MSGNPTNNLSFEGTPNNENDSAEIIRAVEATIKQVFNEQRLLRDASSDIDPLDSETTEAHDIAEETNAETAKEREGSDLVSVDFGTRTQELSVNVKLPDGTEISANKKIVDARRSLRISVKDMAQAIEKCALLVGDTAVGLWGVAVKIGHVLKEELLGPGRERK